MSVANAALIVIDAQESFRHRPYFRVDRLDAYLERQQALIDGARKAGVPIVQVFHVEETGAFAESSGSVTTLAPLRLAPDAIFRKRRHSALIGSGLVNDQRINWVWSPPLGPDKITEDGREQLRAPRLHRLNYGRVQAVW